MMLYPVRNKYRDMTTLDGFWDFQPDPDKVGEEEAWFSSLPDPRPIAVPASWNTQYADLAEFFGLGWYQTETTLPSYWQQGSNRIYLRVGSANYAATVWLNGERVGHHEGGHLPFALDVTGIARPGESNTLTILVDAELLPDRVPPGRQGGNIMMGGTKPSGAFDFYPYSGLHRSVQFVSQPFWGIEDVTVTTDIDGANGLVHINVLAESFESVTAEMAGISASATGDDGSIDLTLRIPEARFWSPEDPYLYKLTVSLGTVDAYSLNVGIRTVAVQGDKLLLNGQPVFLKGFGKHEDFPFNGRGLNRAVVLRDAELYDWVGANSYRTSHYPYSEDWMDMADRRGYLIIDEIPAVGLDFSDAELVAKRSKQCSRALCELVMRDKNHPSVIAWSVANEPAVAHMGGMGPMGGAPQQPPQEAIDRGAAYFKAMIGLAHDLDSSRPALFVALGSRTPDSWFEASDIVCINQYPGWYFLSGDLEQARLALGAALDECSKFGKPVMLTEFGADTVAGYHATNPEMFTEEYQSAMIEMALSVIAERPYMTGFHNWCFADFATLGNLRRVGGENRKGVFTRLREPKMAAHTLRRAWKGEEE